MRALDCSCGQHLEADNDHYSNRTRRGTNTTSVFRIGHFCVLKEIPERFSFRHLLVMALLPALCIKGIGYFAKSL